MNQAETFAVNEIELLLKPDHEEVLSFNRDTLKIYKRGLALILASGYASINKMEIDRNMDYFGDGEKTYVTYYLQPALRIMWKKYIYNPYRFTNISTDIVNTIISFHGVRLNPKKLGIISPWLESENQE